MTGPFEVLVEILRQDPAQARKLADDHALTPDGRCKTCKGGADGTGNTHGCSIGAAARAALAARDDGGDRNGSAQRRD